MYRISREGRRSSAYDHHDLDNKPTRYIRERSLLDNDDQNKNKGFSGGVAGAAGVLPTRNPTAVLCLKVAAGLLALFLVRGVSAVLEGLSAGLSFSLLLYVLMLYCLL